MNPAPKTNVILMADDDDDDRLLTRDAVAEAGLDSDLHFVENGEDRVGECAGGVGGQLGRDPGARAEHRIAQIDVEGVAGLRMHGVIEVHADVGDVEPLCLPLSAAARGERLRDVGAHLMPPGSARRTSRCAASLR